MALIQEDSPLRRPPAEFSRRQVLILDGIRYAAEMSHIAYERLFDTLQALTPTERESHVRETATAMLDAWSVVDSAHRFGDLVEHLPGLPNSAWKRLLRGRTDDIAALRNQAQHQLGEIDVLIARGGQLWGYLSWAEFRDGTHTGKWLMIAAGSHYPGDKWLFMGPAKLPFSVPPGRIRLNAFGVQVYLGRTVAAIAEAVDHLSSAITNGTMKPVGEPDTERRGADTAAEGYVEFLYTVPPQTNINTARLAAE
jgi:hypothetical protein